MFERFTDRARRVVVLAQEEARLLNHDYIGTEHLLLGLVQEGEGVGAKALEALGIRLDAVRSQVEDTIGRGGGAPQSGHIPFTPRAKRALEHSLRAALDLGHNYIGTEHLLLGLIRQEDGVAAQVLARMGASLERVRQQVIQMLAFPEAAESSAVRVPRAKLTAAVAGILAEVAREAEARDHTFAGTEHLLLSLLGQADSGAVQALREAGVDVDALRLRLERILDEGNGSRDPQPGG